ncbi:ATP-binding protein [Salmonella enterica]|uniref:ATP-binding protein n=1 Tax=Salmonella enterica TaxID=28901 RepID=UPI000429C619|nr:ATP-binding protein [Salmonella enterica]
MAKQIIQGTTEINSLGIKNHFESVEPVQAILELVWNGFDAGAKNININIVYDHFDTVKNLTILDDGDGINFTDLGSNFNRFNDSLKKQALINTVLKVEGVYHFIDFAIRLSGIPNT